MREFYDNQIVHRVKRGEWGSCITCECWTAERKVTNTEIIVKRKAYNDKRLTCTKRFGYRTLVESKCQHWKGVKIIWKMTLR